MPAAVNAYGGGNSATALDTIREVIDQRNMAPRVWLKYTRLA